MTSRTKPKGKRLLFDIETNGLLDTLERIHCIWIKDLDTEEFYEFHDYFQTLSPHTGNIGHAVEMLDGAELLVGHNILHYDIPAVQLLYPGALRGFSYFGGKPIFDTLIASRLIWPEILVSDFERFGVFEGTGKDRKLVATKGNFPRKHLGKHGLEAWGYRKKLLKGDYSQSVKDFSKELKALKDPALILTAIREKHPSWEPLVQWKPDGSFDKLFEWAAWNADMHAYCKRDVEVNAALLQEIRDQKYSNRSLTLEHKFAEVLLKQELHGVPFDVPKAEALKAKLITRKAELEDELQRTFPPWSVFEWFTPKVNNSKLGYEKDVPFRKEHQVVFNPGSRTHIENRLTKLRGWKPLEWTPSGRAKIDDVILGRLPYPEAKPITEYLLLQKRLGQLAEGTNAWLNLVKPDGRIHGRVITNGTPHGRCSHQKPNITAVPRVTAEYGEECRSLFYAPDGWVMVGCDAAGIQLRCLAGFMRKFDGGAYMKVVLQGDPHTFHQKVTGIASRDKVKTFLYALLFGARGPTLSLSTGGTADDAEKLRQKFLTRIPAFNLANSECEEFFRATGTLVGLDGRIVPLRGANSALNYRLTNAEACIVKQATVFFYEDATAAGLVFGVDYALVIHAHDELQVLCREHLAETIGPMVAAAIKRAGEYFKFPCPMKGEYKIGRNWAETH
ncbi:hypothetical protein GIW81_00940 [Hyphomicrobium sp. xq]|uniref:DNA-directed DNA polymerase family A palm domain-containing protein n=1 Tax=Hyphomicrobium album TaxID=2665159 RepID=A0A6I3KDG1_9HYPH|nr:DNA polymerase [Hyphomicrobium album]MTD92894.1 hypothetical protein [Hyphomicrobium album]